MLCPHCMKEIYSQVTSFNLDNGATCNAATSIFNGQSFNVNPAAGCNPTIASYPAQSSFKFRYDMATGNMVQVQEEL